MDNTSVAIFDCFTKKQVSEINKEIEKNIARREDEAAKAKDTTKRGDFFHVPCIPLMELLHPWLYECQLINRNDFGYDIYWDFHLDAFNYNVYGIEGEYDWHVDSNPSESDIKLTCLLNLSEESYEGGEFHIIKENQKSQRFDPGMGLVFNSLIAHKVTPVTKGKRITLTYLAFGPPWR